jgi:hypothetical protein
MTRTDDPQKAADYIVRLLEDESTHGTFDGAGAITSFAQVHDYCDANEFLELAVAGDRLTDFEFLSSVADLVDVALASSPVRTA